MTVFKMATAPVQVSVTEENLTDINSLLIDSCCEKCSELETRLQETLHELSSAHFKDCLKTKWVSGRIHQGSTVIVIVSVVL